MPSFLDSPFAESEFPPRELQPGAIVRVQVLDGSVIEGVLQAVDRRGLQVENRGRHLQPTFRGAAGGGLFIEEEEAPSKRARGVAWNQIATIRARSRATTAGLLWGVILTLFLSWCGDGLDHLTDGTPKTQAGYIGIAVGIVIGVLVARLGREWRTVWTANAASTLRL